MFKFSFLGRNKRRQKGSGKKYPDWYKEAHGLNSASSSLIWLKRVNHKYGSGFYGLDFDLKKTWTWYPEKRQLNWFQYWNVCEKDGFMSDLYRLYQVFARLLVLPERVLVTVASTLTVFACFPDFKPFFGWGDDFLIIFFNKTTTFIGGLTPEYDTCWTIHGELWGSTDCGQQNMRVGELRYGIRGCNLR